MTDLEIEAIIERVGEKKRPLDEVRDFLLHGGDEGIAVEFRVSSLVRDFRRETEFGADKAKRRAPC